MIQVHRTLVLAIKRRGGGHPLTLVSRHNARRPVGLAALEMRDGTWREAPQARPRAAAYSA